MESVIINCLLCVIGICLFIHICYGFMKPDEVGVPMNWLIAFFFTCAGTAFLYNEGELGIMWIVFLPLPVIVLLALFLRLKWRETEPKKLNR